ncbi:MAG TPA: hypothetical protein DCM45_00685, partial [Clostridiales bacterium]|nr:hypothetical protein [Clostridiales bacterium]
SKAIKPAASLSNWYCVPSISIATSAIDMACGRLACVDPAVGWTVVSTADEVPAGKVADCVVDPSVIGAATTQADNMVSEINNKIVNKNRFMALPFS